MIKLLVADDEQHIREGIKKFVLKKNLEIDEVLTASSGEEALEIYEAEHPDIIVSDIVMPGSGGLEFVKEVFKRNKKVKIILISGHSDIRYFKEGFSVQALDYILKPIDPKELETVLLKAVGMCSENAENPRKDKNGKSGRIVKQVKTLIGEKYASGIFVQEIADKLKITPNYLSTVFRLETGEKLIDYITRFRMEKAGSLLRNTDMPIRDIATSVGYSDQNYFAKVFRKYFEMSPTQYREK